MWGKLPIGIATAHGVLPFRDIHESFRDTSYGKILAENIRYHLYKPQETSNAEWESILGPDVNNLEHHWWSYLVTRAFICSSNSLLEIDEDIQYAADVFVHSSKPLIDLLEQLLHSSKSRVHALFQFQEISICGWCHRVVHAARMVKDFSLGTMGVICLCSRMVIDRGYSVGSMPRLWLSKAMFFHSVWRSYARAS